MATDRLLLLSALAALLLAPAGCDRGGDDAPPQPAPEAQVSPEEQAYRKAVEDVNDERRRLMTEATAAQESGDPERIAAAAKALVENRRKAAETVRDRKDFSNKDFSSKEQTK